MMIFMIFRYPDRRMANPPTQADPRDTVPGAWLIPVAGPSLGSLALNPASDRTITIGRLDTCDLVLPADADKVSRVHARFIPAGDSFCAWRIADANSRWGTYLNGVRLESGREMPLAEGDLIRVTPWTFSFTTRPPNTRGGLQSIHDEQSTHTLIRSHTDESSAGHRLAGDLLGILLEAAAGIHAAVDDAALAALVLEEACRGTGLPNGAFLRPLDNQGRVEVVAVRSAVPLGDDAPLFSRSLMLAAAGGAVAMLTPRDMASASASASIVQARIDTAICVPLMLGGAVAAYLYLDSRSRHPGAAPRLHPAAANFCVALGRMASLALANLKRIDIERRQAAMESELCAAAAAQKWILPPRQQTIGPLEVLGESRPGRYVGGDFFDVIPLPEGRLAVALGDVSGKGVVASVLMTATQGYLHAALRQHGDVGRAVGDLNLFINPRRPESRFVTLWVGVIDPAARTLCYVDAGHGYALLIAPDGSATPLSEGAGLPIGVMSEAVYEPAITPLPEKSRVLVVSDGFIEQPAAGSASDHDRQFDLAGVKAAIAGAAGDELAALFAALTAHAGGPRFADDATAVITRCP